MARSDELAALVERMPPELLTTDEEARLLFQAECLWRDLTGNNLGGFSDGNRPFYILWKFKEVIEEFSHRDVGLTWSKDELDTLKRMEQDT